VVFGDEYPNKFLVFITTTGRFGGNMGPIKYGVPTTRKFPKLAII
jgi:hypothetical protein